MKIYIAFDDTDTLDCGRGTGKLARWFEQELPESCQMVGVVRHQLLVADDIPYTSHNSSLCMIAQTEQYEPQLLDVLAERASKHIKNNFFDGSDPGLCIAAENNNGLTELLNFAHVALHRKVTQVEAIEAANDIHLSGHGGTNDGIIGAAAAVGLTHHGMSGRFIEFGKTRLREYEEVVTIGSIRNNNIEVLPVDRHSPLPLDYEKCDTLGWLRPRLFMGKAVLPIQKNDKGIWETVGKNIGNDGE